MVGTRKTSPRKAAANRANALRSTGPKTPEGKAAVARNAIRHGILSRACLMSGEDRAALDALRAELVAALAPVGAVEELLADQLVGVVWRLRRANAMESGTLGGAFVEALMQYGFDTPRLVARCLGNDEASPVDEMRELGAIGAAVCRDNGAAAVTLERVARYGSALERSVFRTLHELERVQARRLGQAVPLPVALDVTMDAPLPPGPH